MKGQHLSHCLDEELHLEAPYSIAVGGGGEWGYTSSLCDVEGKGSRPGMLAMCRSCHPVEVESG